MRLGRGQVIDAVRQREITNAQRRIWKGRPSPIAPRRPRDYQRVARWWALESRRGYASAAESMQYARNMMWAAELARVYGPGTWLQLQARQKAATIEPSGGR